MMHSRFSGQGQNSVGDTPVPSSHGADLGPNVRVNQ